LTVVLLVSIISLNAFRLREMTINDFVNHWYARDNILIQIGEKAPNVHRIFVA